VLESIKRHFAAKEANIKRKISQLLLKEVFGGTSTAEDVAVAKERLQKALREAKTFDEVIDACRSYILVKANHLLQKNGERLPHDSDVLSATKKNGEGGLEGRLPEGIAKHDSFAVEEREEWGGGEAPL
jgi:hypothetical protein